MSKNKKSSPSLYQKLHKALLQDGELSDDLYDFELKEHIPEWTEDMKKDGDELVFVVTENTGFTAMLLITGDEELLVNEAAREYLKAFWQDNYVKTVEMLLPMMVDDLNAGYLSVNGVKKT